MTRGVLSTPLTLLLAAALLIAPAAAQHLDDSPGLNAAPTLDERIDKGLSPTDDMAPEPLAPIPPDKQESQPDVSLAAPAGPSRLRTTLDPLDIEARIDKGLTAAGEASSLPADYAFGAFQRGWFLTAFSLALDRAKDGDPTAQTLLGVLLSRGLGVKQDLAAAADWFGLAGKGGDREALYALGQIYLAGQGLAVDVAKAAELFRQAADLGHPGAARELGYLLLQGNGAEKNAMLAAAYLHRAAVAGDMDAQYTLAGLYVEGVGVVSDDVIAARWFGEAARNGHVGAQVEYGLMLFNGKGIKKDETGAASWFTHAANADNPAAQLRLARMFADGRGVDADPKEAARWYLIAKNHGLDDDRMEDWLRRLDAPALEEARKAADAWSRYRPQLQAAASPAKQPAPVDKQVE